MFQLWRVKDSGDRFTRDVVVGSAVILPAFLLLGTYEMRPHALELDLVFPDEAHESGSVAARLESDGVWRGSKSAYCRIEAGRCQLRFEWSRGRRSDAPWPAQRLITIAVGERREWTPVGQVQVQAPALDPVTVRCASKEGCAAAT
jgi:hypothetical protein